MSEAPPLGAEAEPEAHPLSRPLVPFGRCRKELALPGETGKRLLGRDPASRRVLGTPGRKKPKTRLGGRPPVRLRPPKGGASLTVGLPPKNPRKGYGGVSISAQLAFRRA